MDYQWMQWHQCHISSNRNSEENDDDDGDNIIDDTAKFGSNLSDASLNKPRVKFSAVD